MPHEIQQIAAKPKTPKMTHPACAKFSLEMEFRCLETSGKTFVYHNNAALTPKNIIKIATIKQQQEPPQQGSQLQLKQPQRTLQHSAEAGGEDGNRLDGLLGVDSTSFNIICFSDSSYVHSMYPLTISTKSFLPGFISCIMLSKKAICLGSPSIMFC